MQRIRNKDSENITIAEALDRYLKEVTPTKKPSTRRGDYVQAKQLSSYMGYHTTMRNSDTLSLLMG